MSLRMVVGVPVTFVTAATAAGLIALVSAVHRNPAGDIHLDPDAPLVFRAVVTAYSSSPDETWGDPFITASGRPVFDGLVACPRRFPFGTKFRIGRRTYACWDRLHEKFDERFDIWMSTKEKALTFGRRLLTVEVSDD